MSGWIKFWKDMPNDPRVLAAAQKLSERYVLAERTAGGGIDLSSNALCNAWRNAVVGALATLWAYADEHIRNDDTLPLTSQTVDAVVGLEGFFSVMPREWIDELEDGSIVLPGYCEKNSLIAKRKRAVKSNARVTRWRRGKNASRNGVTRSHVTHHTVGGDLDQDLDINKRKQATHRCPPDFAVSEKLRAWARQKVPSVDVDTETERMRDYEFKHARKDWSAVWREWMRTAADRKGSGNGAHQRNGQQKPSAVESVERATAEWAEQRGVDPASI